MNAMEQIGDDLIDRAAADMEAPAVRGMAIWTKGIAAAACVCLLAGGAYAGIWYWNGTENVGSDSPSLNAGGGSQAPAVQTTEPGAPTAPIQTTIGSMPDVPENTSDDYFISMEKAYPYHEKRNFFAKMIIDESIGVFVNSDGEKQYLLIKCTVLLDYYGTIKSGAQIVLKVPLRLEYDEKYAEAKVVTNFLSQFDYLFVYANKPGWGDFLYSLETNEQFDIETSAVFLGDYHILPVLDGKLDIYSLRAFWNENGIPYVSNDLYDRSFWMYVHDGLSAEEFAENIRENKERQINKS